MDAVLTYVLNNKVAGGSLLRAQTLRRFLLAFDDFFLLRCAAFFSPRLSFFIFESTLTIRPLRPELDFGVIVLPTHREKQLRTNKSQ
jgi:hypothetical protein